MTECIAQQTLPFHCRLPVVVRYDAPETSSNGGALLLRQMDEQLRLTEGLARCLSDDRDPSRVRHDRHEQVRQRVFQIALGYEDGNDADTLRQDPLLKTVCERTPNDTEGLSSQPTLSRFENAVHGRSLKKLLSFLENSYVRSLSAEAKVVILDIDATDDETHGRQQLSFFHGYYDHHMYHPLLVYDGVSGQLITAVLRPGNTHASRGAKGVLRRLVRKIRRRCPQAAIVVRADSGFCVPRLLRELERLETRYGGVDYLFGLARNPVLVRLLEPEMQRAEEIFKRRQEKVVRFTSFAYAAASWPHRRRVVGKAERTSLGRNPRFVLTSLEGFGAEELYRAYCERGRCENWIKDLKNALYADRLSCTRFRANFFRLLLHAAAYRLMHALRQELATISPILGRAQFDTLRLRLLRVAAQVRQSVRRVLVRLPRAFPQADVFAQLLDRLTPQPQPVPI